MAFLIVDNICFRIVQSVEQMSLLTISIVGLHSIINQVKNHRVERPVKFFLNRQADDMPEISRNTPNVLLNLDFFLSIQYR